MLCKTFHRKGAKGAKERKKNLAFFASWRFRFFYRL